MQPLPRPCVTGSGIHSLALVPALDSAGFLDALGNAALLQPQP